MFPRVSSFKRRVNAIAGRTTYRAKLGRNAPMVYKTTSSRTNLMKVGILGDKVLTTITKAAAPMVHIASECRVSRFTFAGHRNMPNL